MAGQQPAYGSVPAPSDSQFGHGYGAQDFAMSNHNPVSSPLSQTMNNTGGYGDDYDTSQRGNSVVGGSSVEGSAGVNRATSSATTAVQGLPSRSNTLRKRSSVRRVSSLRRSSSKRSLKAGSLAGFGGADSNQEYNSFGFTPVPTSGAPTEVLANRFQSWRQLLKSLITYFREIQASYDTRQKAILKVQNTVANIVHPSVFMSDHGLGEATRILDEFHRKSVAEANKSRDIEADVIGALTGLRNDLGQKIKEIKSLSGDFKNSVEKEQDATRKAVEQYQDALDKADHEDGSAMGKNDPFVVRLGVDRMIERQIDEENYLHRAYLNLESSGRELESIVVGEIQKAFNALAGILKREGDDAYNTVELLRSGPISMPKDAEWMQFVTKDEHFVDPSMPLRRIEDIHYPGKDNPAAAEVRAGMLERKSKYLKSYTPGWYVLSPTHLHEFKSADKIFSQPPVMSLYLPDQKLGSRSQEDSSSHKFMLKGKQSGGMHKGHNWVFRAESYDTMVAWYNDIKVLTEATGEQRNNFVRKHARSISGTSDRATVSSDGLEEDEADAVPYSADVTSLSAQNATSSDRPVRPQPGGRFPSDLRVPQNRDTTTARRFSSDSDNDDGAAAAGGAAAATIAASAAPAPISREDYYGGQDPYRLAGVTTGNHTRNVSGVTDTTGTTGSSSYARSDDPEEPALYAAATGQNAATEVYEAMSYPQTFQPTPQRPQQPSFLAASDEPATGYPAPFSPSAQYYNNDSSAYQQPTPTGLQRNAAEADWVAPAAVTAGAAGAGLAAAEAYRHHQQQEQQQEQQQQRDFEEEEGKGTEPFPALEDYSAQQFDSFAEQQPGVVPSAAAAPVADPAHLPPHQQHQQSLESLPDSLASSVVPPAASGNSTSATDAAAGGPTAGATGSAGSRLAGNERLGARETGTIPTVIRHESSMSISMLHVPGEFPKRG